MLQMQQIWLPRLTSERKETTAMLISCPGCNRNKIDVPDTPDGYTYLCIGCYIPTTKAILKTLSLIKLAKKPHLAIAQSKEKDIAA